ncbi:MAG: hypothetical protein AB7S75_20375 [Desulfococcaceae bacterium]
MNALFYTAVILLLLILRTVAFPLLFQARADCDLFLPLVLHLSVFRPFREGIPAVLGLGLLTDSLSAAPFGLHLTIYLWFFVIIKWGITFLHVRSRLFLPLIILPGILFEELLFLTTLKLSGAIPFSSVLSPPHAGHILLTAVTGPFLFTAISAMHRKWQHLTQKIFPEKKMKPEK